MNETFGLRSDCNVILQTSICINLHLHCKLFHNFVWIYIVVIVISCGSFHKLR